MAKWEEVPHKGQNDVAGAVTMPSKKNIEPTRKRGDTTNLDDNFWGGGEKQSSQNDTVAPEVANNEEEEERVRVETVHNPLHSEQCDGWHESTRSHTPDFKARASTMFMQVVQDTKDKRHEKESSRSTVKIMWAAHKRKHVARWSPNEFMTCFFVLIFFFGPHQMHLSLIEAGGFITTVSEITAGFAAADVPPRNESEALHQLIDGLRERENAQSQKFCRFNLKCSELHYALSSSNSSSEPFYSLSWGEAAKHHTNLVTPNALVSNLVYVLAGVLLLVLSLWQKRHLKSKLKACGPCLCHSLHDSKHWDNRPMVFEQKIGVRTVCPRHQMIWQLPGHGRMNIMIALAFINEGVFSAAYHICPTSSSLQYDYVGISLLGVAMLLAMYTKRHAVPPMASNVCKVLGVFYLFMLWNDRARLYTLTAMEQLLMEAFGWAGVLVVVGAIMYERVCAHHNAVKEKEENDKHVKQQVAFLRLVFGQSCEFEKRGGEGEHYSRGENVEYDATAGGGGEGGGGAVGGGIAIEGGIAVGGASTILRVHHGVSETVTAGAAGAAGAAGGREGEGEEGADGGGNGGKNSGGSKRGGENDSSSISHTRGNNRRGSVHTVALLNEAAATTAPIAYLSGCSFSYVDVHAHLQAAVKSSNQYTGTTTDDGDDDDFSDPASVQRRERVTGLLQEIVTTAAEVGRGEFWRAATVQRMQNEMEALRLQELAALCNQLQPSGNSVRRASNGKESILRHYAGKAEEEVAGAMGGVCDWISRRELVHHIKTTTSNKGTTVSLLMSFSGLFLAVMYSLYNLATKGTSVAGELFMVVVLATLCCYMLYYITLKWYYDWSFVFELEVKYFYATLCCRKEWSFFNDDDLTEAFNVLDVDGNQTISGANLQHIMGQLGQHLTQHKARAMIKVLSKRPNSETLNLAEFKEVVRGKKVHRIRELLRPILVKVLLLHGLLAVGLAVLLQAGVYFKEKEYVPETSAQETLAYTVGPDSIGESLALNENDELQACTFSSYFDNHDMWHFLSGLALFLFAIVVACIEHPSFVIASTSDQMVVF
jgi:hypothetical protein